jgi:hypothetical protein
MKSFKIVSSLIVSMVVVLSQSKDYGLAFDFLLQLEEEYVNIQELELQKSLRDDEEAD